jgi:hypothetical protein
VAALSLATDAGTGQPFEHVLRTCLLAVRVADALDVAPTETSTVGYTTLPSGAAMTPTLAARRTDRVVLPSEVDQLTGGGLGGSARVFTSRPGQRVRSDAA